MCRGEYRVEKALDLGEGGLSFASELLYPQGLQMTLSFQIPNGTYVVIRSQMVRFTPVAIAGKKIEAKTFHHGCSFLNIKFEKKREIRNYVSERK